LYINAVHLLDGFTMAIIHSLNQKDSLIGKRADEIAFILGNLGEPGYRARQIYQWIHHHNVDSFEEITSISKSLRQTLFDNFLLHTLTMVKQQTAGDGTIKFLWRLPDDRHIESVLIPELKRNTICISSQVGCPLDCHFCATGNMGLVRNLSPGEIVDQVLSIKKLTNLIITNVVFMGMGEPFLNYARSIKACKILGDPEGVGIAQNKITISTSGIIPKIYQYTEEKNPYNLAISLHAPNQEIRQKIMPIAFKFPLPELMESIRYYTNVHKRNRVTFEYVLLHGVNDSAKEAKELISLLSPIRCKLNIIPCNKNNLGFKSPSNLHLEKFMAILTHAPFAVTLRKNRGEDITAACGQLAVELQEKSIFIKY
jgi:23S rRNA (adenine2503-C2)-methyltransferase